MKLGAAYIRTSVDKTGNKISPQQQYNAIKGFADNNSITLVNEGYYDEDVSSENFEDRPAFQQLLEDIDKYNIKYIVFYDSSRYTRVVKDFINMTTNLQEKGVKIFLANSGKEVNLLDWNNNTMMDLIQSIFDQNMREDVRKKVKANINELVDMGCYIGGPIPIGLSIEEVEINERKRKRYCLGDTKEIELVKNIFKWYLEDDKSLSEIVRLADEEFADILNENDVKKYRKNGTENNYNGVYFNSKKIWRILRNPSYTGYMVKNRRERITKKKRKDSTMEEWYWSKNFREGKEPDFTPIVSFEKWEKVQKKCKQESLNKSTMILKEKIALIYYQAC
ncbi:recombinase family protein [Radiobacillus sp. PE A8.2]|uniref:recombinase family protein n=1 Tax=Radiobacillus sp. PE A8.2 TaxID=3380349 RepID=UPI00388D9307